MRNAVNRHLTPCTSSSSRPSPKCGGSTSGWHTFTAKRADKQGAERRFLQMLQDSEVLAALNRASSLAHVPLLCVTCGDVFECLAWVAHRGVFVQRCLRTLFPRYEHALNRLDKPVEDVEDETAPLCNTQGVPVLFFGHAKTLFRVVLGLVRSDGIKGSSSACGPTRRLTFASRRARRTRPPHRCLLSLRSARPPSSRAPSSAP